MESDPGRNRASTVDPLNHLYKCAATNKGTADFDGTIPRAQNTTTAISEMRNTTSITRANSQAVHHARESEIGLGDLPLELIHCIVLHLDSRSVTNLASSLPHLSVSINSKIGFFGHHEELGVTKWDWAMINGAPRRRALWLRYAVIRTGSYVKVGEATELYGSLSHYTRLQRLEIPGNTHINMQGLKLLASHLQHLQYLVVEDSFSLPPNKFIDFFASRKYSHIEVDFSASLSCARILWGGNPYTHTDAGATNLYYAALFSKYLPQIVRYQPAMMTESALFYQTMLSHINRHTANLQQAKRVMDRMEEEAKLSWSGTEEQDPLLVMLIGAEDGFKEADHEDDDSEEDEDEDGHETEELDQNELEWDLVDELDKQYRRVDSIKRFKECSYYKASMELAALTMPKSSRANPGPSMRYCKKHGPVFEPYCCSQKVHQSRNDGHCIIDWFALSHAVISKREETELCNKIKWMFSEASKAHDSHT